MIPKRIIRTGLFALAAAISSPLARAQDMQRAYEYNWEWRCEEAGKVYSKVRSETERSAIDLQLDSALNTSCQGLYARADSLFDEVKPRIEAQADAFLSIKYGILHAQHLANKGDRPGALVETDDVIRRLIEADKSMGPAARDGMIRIGMDAASQFNSKRPEGAERASADVFSPEERNKVLLGQAYWLKSELELGQGRPQQAMDAIRLSVKSLPENPRVAVWLRGQISLTDAEIALQTGDPQKAVNGALSAATMLERFYPGSLPQAALYTVAARGEAAMGHADRGLELARQAFDIRASLPDERAQTWKRAQPLFDILYDKIQSDSSPLLRKEFVNRSSELVEDATAGVLEDLVLRLSVNNPELTTALDEQQKLELEMRRSNAALQRLRDAQQTTTADYVTIAASADKLESAHDAAVERVRVLREKLGVPISVFRLGDMRPEETSFAKFQGALTDGSLYVRFLIGESKSYAVVVPKAGDPAVYRLTWSVGERSDCVGVDRPQGDASTPQVNVNMADVKDCVARLLEMEFTERDGRPDLVGKTRPYRLPAAYALYHGLFGKFAGGVDQSKRLVIEASGALNRLPFSALVIGKADGRDIRTVPLGPTGYDYSVVRFLGIEKPLVFSSSAASFIRLSQTPPSKATREFLGLGAFVPPADPAVAADRLAATVDPYRRDECRSEYVDIYSASELPNSLPELLDVRRTVGGVSNLVTRGDFSENWLRDNQKLLADYKVLFFSTHGMFPKLTNKSCISEPLLIASLDPAADLKAADGVDLVADGMLQAVEIGGLKLDADLVVLSACETAGGIGGGSGRSEISYSALANMFFVAQARALLAAQFDVPDDTTRMLMVDLFKHRAAGEDLATSLQEASRTIWSKAEVCASDGTACHPASHPIYWAGFMLIGANGKAS